jgi:hypothetical protein
VTRNFAPPKKKHSTNRSLDRQISTHLKILIFPPIVV